MPLSFPPECSSSSISLFSLSLSLPLSLFHIWNELMPKFLLLSAKPYPPQLFSSLCFCLWKSRRKLKKQKSKEKPIPMWTNTLHPNSWKSRDRRSRKDLHTSETVSPPSVLLASILREIAILTLFSLLPWLAIYFQHSIQPAGDLINREHFLSEEIALSISNIEVQ